ncbi:MAG: AAA family ATPase, partial [Thermoplasmata archaeon]|nr:AAA family ATPase [Thermoplasmata archaeon]
SVEKFIIGKDLVSEFQVFLKEMAGLDLQLDKVRIGFGMDDVFVQKTPKKNLVFNAVSSSGTKCLMLFYYWLKHFDDVEFLYMDEFDAYYHYELATNVLKKVAEFDHIQAILTSHNTTMVSNDILRPDCYLQLSDGKVRPFSDLTDRELREGHNLEKMLRNGEFDV